MANLNLKIQQCWTCQVGAATSYSSVSVPIINSGKTNSGAYPSYTSKLSFTTPPFLNKNEKITITVTAKAGTHNSKEVTMALSASNYTKIDSVVSPVGYNYNWMASELKSTVIAQTLRGDNGFVLNQVSLLPNTTYYLYFLRVGATPINGGYTARYEGKDPQISISLANLAKPPAPAIITKTQILPYQGELTLNWNAVNSPKNPLKGYRVFLWRNNSTNPEVTADTTANSYKFSLKSYNRDDSITVGVCAISSYEAYKNSYADYLKNCNSDTSTIEAGVINILPVINSVTTKGNNNTIGGSTGVTFLINAEDGNPSQSSSLSYYYTLNNNIKKSLGNSNSLTLTLDGLRSEGITETGTYTVTFYVFDGMEYSEAKTATFYAEFAPIISVRGEVPDYITDGAGNDSKYIKSITLNFTLKNNVTSGLTAVVKFKIGEQKLEISNNYYTLNISKPQKTISIDITKIPVDILPYGSSFCLVYEIKNQVGLSSGDDNWSSNIYYRPSKLEQIPSITITNDALDKDDRWQYNFKQTLTFDFIAPPIEEGRPDIKAINLVVNSNNVETSFQLGKDEEELYSQVKIDLIKSVQAGQTAKLKIQVEDVAGQVTEKEIPQLYTRITTPSFSEQGVNAVLPKELNPHTYTGSLNIKHIIATNSSNQNIDIAYSYKCIIHGHGFQFNVLDVGSDNNTIRVEAENVADFNANVLNIIGKTNIFNNTADIEVIATDAFDQTVSKFIAFTINSDTAPTFLQKFFSLRHDYDVSGSSSREVAVINNDLNSQIFNPGEGIIFKIPKPKDPNEDVSKFNIYLHRGKLPLDKEDIPSYDDVDYGNTPWLVISKDNLEGQDESEEFYTYRHTASAYQENEYFYFKITATDERGNESSKYSGDDPKAQKNGHVAVYSEIYIIGARVAPAQIEVEPVETEIDGTSVTIKFKLTETDFGGSATTDDNGNIVWDQKYYNNYPNLAREIASNEIEEEKFINWKKRVLMEISPTSDFSGVVFSKEEDYNTNAEDYIFENYPENSIKVYVRITLKVPYALENGNQKYISSISAVYSYFGEAPTIAYRPHKVGINVKAIDDEAVLVIQSYKNYKKIIIGPDEDHKIIIDIENQTIDGVTINCGSW